MNTTNEEPARLPPPKDAGWSGPTTLAVLAAVFGIPIWFAHDLGYGHFVDACGILLGGLLLLGLIVLIIWQALDEGLPEANTVTVFTGAVLICTALGALSGHNADVSRHDAGSGYEDGVRVRYYTVDDRTRSWDEYWSGVASRTGWGVVYGVVVGCMAVGYLQNEHDASS